MFYKVLGILFVVWVFFRIIAQLVMQPYKLHQCTLLRDYSYAILGVIFTGLMLNGIMWACGAQ